MYFYLDEAFLTLDDHTLEHRVGLTSGEDRKYVLLAINEHTRKIKGVNLHSKRVEKFSITLETSEEVFNYTRN